VPADTRLSAADVRVGLNLVIRRCPLNVRITLGSGLRADIDGRRRSANGRHCAKDKALAARTACWYPAAWEASIITSVKLPRRQFLNLAAGAAALPALSRIASAQTYPSRPITIVIGYAAGGPTDTRVRILAQHMRGTLGQSVIVENMTGASGSLAIARVGRAAADGYTLSSGDWGTHVVNGAIYTLQHDLLGDFEPIALLSSTPLLVLSRNAVPAMDLMELIGWIKSNSTKISFGTSGPGSPSHASGLLLQKLTGVQVQYVPYRGGSLVLQDLIAGQIDMTFGALSTSLPAVRDGKIKAYAVTGNGRSAAAPNIATVDEAGLPGLHLSLWGGLWAPKGTSKDVIGMLNAAVVAAMDDPTVRQRLADLGEEIPLRAQQTPDALAVHHKAEIEKWWPIIKAANIKGE
jgi:tripartite-type tricarboxylate transporter receptor subunit TctC